MKVLVVGGGGREHALAWAISGSASLDKLYIAPGNGGTALLGENVPIGADDVEALTDFAANEGIDLTVVGPEAPLVGGIVDRFAQRRLLCFGPHGEAARLEGSKVFAKEFMARHGIPTAAFKVFDEAHSAMEYIERKREPVVVKADGLAMGKGAYVSMTSGEAMKALDEIMIERRFGTSGDKVVIEELLEGEELSVQAVCWGEGFLLLPSSQDHKRAHDGDRGPNTGGMGAYAPVPFIGERAMNEVAEKIVRPVLVGMAAEGMPYRGVLYAGLMMTREGPKVLEFNARFGDPETQAVVPLIEGDFLELLTMAAQGRDPGQAAPKRDTFAVAVVVASGGYPGHYEKGFPIEGLETVEDERRMVFHAGTGWKDGRLVTTGGRVLAVVATGRELSETIAHAYEGVQRIRFEQAFFRTDIGRKALMRTSIEEEEQ